MVTAASVLLIALNCTAIGEQHLATGGDQSGLQAVLDDIRQSQDVPGISAVVVRDDDILFAGASGVADIETGRPMTVDTVLYIGSVSKTLTAVLTLNLVEAERLSLQNDVAGIAVETTDDTPRITIAQLLTHTSGLEREGNFNYWFTGDFPDTQSLDRYLANTQLRSLPGTTQHYSNVGYAALGRAIETATGSSYGQALRERVLAPLNMNASGVAAPVTNLANGYTPLGRILPSSARPFAGIGRRVGERHVRMYHNARAMSPAFGIHSTARELGRLAMFLLGSGNDAVLSRDMRILMRERQGRGRGLGLRIGRYQGRTVAEHGGWFAAHRAYLLLDPDAGIGIVVLANSDNAAPGEIARALHEAALAMP